MSETYDADDNAERQYQLWLACAREMKVRSGELPPNPLKASEMRQAREGPRSVSELDAVRD